jgi:hypothetical protein
LPAEHFGLFLDWRATKTGQTRIVGARTIQNPTIKTDFTDGRIRVFVEMAD